MWIALFAAFIGLLLIACLYAFWRGGGPERVVAALFLIAWAVSTVTRAVIDVRYHQTAYVTLSIDILLLIGLLAVARRANRAWPVVVTSLQVLVVLAHAARAINQHQIPFVYIVMTEFWPYLQLALLITGTALHSRRVATSGAEPSWKN